MSFRGGKASYWYPGCHSGVVELRTGTLGVIQDSRAAYRYPRTHSGVVKLRTATSHRVRTDGRTQNLNALRPFYFEVKRPVILKHYLKLSCSYIK